MIWRYDWSQAIIGWGFCNIQNNQARRKDLDYSGYHKKPNLTIVLLYIEQKKVWKSCSCFFTDGNQHIASEFDMITLDLECPWHDHCIICSYDITGADLENSIYAFGQSGKR